MKTYLITGITLSILFVFISFTNTNDVIFRQRNGNLQLEINREGKIIQLKDLSRNINYASLTKDNYLIKCHVYETGGSDQVVMAPITAEVSQKTNKSAVIKLIYANDIRIFVQIVNKQDYFQMEIIDVTSVDQISHISWGPYYTTMKGPIAEWIGLNRSDDFTIGMISLEPNTDGVTHMSETASYTEEGASLQLYSFDHTRDRFIFTRDTLRKSYPIPDKTVIGSSVALFACESGKENELNIIEKIELKENLPHPTIDGVWNKRSIEGQKFCLWANYNEQNFGDYLKLAHNMGARILCRPGGYASNWGHFDIDQGVYPGGMPALLEDSRDANKLGIGTTLYTLTTFLKPMGKREPYISPVPDQRLHAWNVKAEVGKEIMPVDTVIYLKKTNELVEVLRRAGHKVMCIDNEMIEFKNYQTNDDYVVAKDCQRGAFLSDVTKHKEETPVKFMFVAGFHNFFPGTFDMSNEISDRLADIMIKTEQGNLVVDGFESCLEAGHGAYTGNVFMRNIYDKCVANHKEFLVTSSNFTQYTWHIMSHESWGEYDLERGFRGTMLDYRLSKQIRLSKNLMPNKLGQYYPNEATVEDVEWIMGLATGWNSGVDFMIDIDVFRKNPQYEEIVKKLRLWTEAREQRIFTEEQKMMLRQTDIQCKLSQDADGTWNLSFDKFWQDKNVRVLPSSVMKAQATDGDKQSVESCSIDWSWTHNPGTYDEIGLSDDLVHTKGTVPSTWTVDYPAYKESSKSWFPTSSRHFQFVLRLPEDAPCSIKNIRVSVNNNELLIPVTLRPGEYLSIPHIIPIVCIYNAEHKVIGEKLIRGSIPGVQKGSKANISLSCEPTDGSKQPKAILNIRCQNGYSFP